MQFIFYANDCISFWSLNSPQLFCKVNDSFFPPRCVCLLVGNLSAL